MTSVGRNGSFSPSPFGATRKRATARMEISEWVLRTTSMVPAGREMVSDGRRIECEEESPENNSFFVFIVAIN